MNYLEQIRQILARKSFTLNESGERKYIERCKSSEIEPYVVADIIIAHSRARALRNA